jgi:hypothetical protein
MKSLYESILDDEDVLIDDIKKSSNNWLLVLKQMIFNNSSEENVLEFLNSKIVENDIKPLFKNFKPVYWEVCLNDDYYDKCITLFGNSLRSVSKSPVILNILIKEEQKRLTIIINKPKSLIASIRRNVNEEKLLNFYKVIEDMDAKPFAGAEKTIYYI